MKNLNKINYLWIFNKYLPKNISNNIYTYSRYKTKTDYQYKIDNITTKYYKYNDTQKYIFLFVKLKDIVFDFIKIVFSLTNPNNYTLKYILLITRKGYIQSIYKNDYFIAVSKHYRYISIKKNNELDKNELANKTKILDNIKKFI